MDLNKLSKVKAQFDDLDDDYRAAMYADALTIRDYLKRSLPALEDSDRAAVAWVLIEVMSTLCDMPMQAAGQSLLHSIAAYGVAAVDLLGWLPDERDPREAA